jgi:hydroxyethylthiazole kinase-like uncharacterized protein yjeF
MHKEAFDRLLNRHPDSNKYDFGHVLVWGGSPGMVGAPLLSALAALRSGAGLVTIASSPEVIDKVEGRVPELMTVSIKTAQDIQSFIKDREVSVIVIGPGLKRHSAGMVRSLLETIDIPVVLDGGGLIAAADNTELLNDSMVLTPHTGEFQHFFDEPLPDSRDELKVMASDFSSRHNVNLVLKGHPTFVARPTGEVFTNKTGNPGLATAGSGDVLAGVIGGFIGQGLDLAQAAAAGVYLHGLAADLAVKTKTQPGLIGSDIIENIPAAFAQQ